MRRRLGIVGVLALSLAGQAAWAADDPKAVIAKAIEAVGGAEVLTRTTAQLTHIQGTMPMVPGTTFTADLYSEGMRASKSVFRLDVAGTKLLMTQVRVGDKGWVDDGMGPHDLDREALADMRQSAVIDRILNLTALLKDDSFVLTHLGSGKSGATPTTRVKVASPGQPDVVLHFETKKGYLIQAEFRNKKETLGKEVQTVWQFQDFREIVPTRAEELVLEAAKVPRDGPGLLAYLRNQTRSRENQARIASLIKGLADDAFEVRRKSSEELVSLGSMAEVALREALRDPDPDVSKRAQVCLDRIKEAGTPEGVLGAALRLAAYRNAPGTTEVLLGLASSFPEDNANRELKSALAVIAIRDGKPDPVLEKALTSSDAAQKAVAMAALGRDGGALAKIPGQRLLIKGIHKPHKVIMSQDDKVEIEWQVLEMQFFNRFEDRLFERPR